MDVTVVVDGDDECPVIVSADESPPVCPCLISIGGCERSGAEHHYCRKSNNPHFPAFHYDTLPSFY